MTTDRPSTRIPIPQSIASYMVRELMGILSLIAVAIFDVGSAPPELGARLPLILLHALFFMGFIGFDLINLRLPISGHLALAIFVIIQALMIWFGSNPTTQVVILFVLSAYAHEALPEFPANLWLLGFGIATMIAFSILMQDALLGSLVGLGALGGYTFIGNASRNRRVAEAARAESQRLLQELQTAHEQLQRHAHEAEVLAAAEERNRVARELHDTLGHRLTVAAVQLEGAQRLIRRDADKAEQMVGVVRGQVLDALAELRQTVAALRTPLEADLALPAAITLLAQQYATATGMHVYVAINDQTLPHLKQLSLNARHTLYRAVQEGLTNIQKHANASAAWIQLERITEPQPILQLSIHDNGKGVPRTIQSNGEGDAKEGHARENDSGAHGFGLAGLTERAAQSHGTVRLEKSQYGGSALILALPLEDATAIPTTNLAMN